jgi:uncharacterized membrane protein YfcA
MVSVKSYAKMGFGMFAGALAAQMIYLAFGLLLLVIGLYMMSSARKRGSSVVPAYIVMGLGVVVGLGLGAGIFFENLQNNLSR